VRASFQWAGCEGVYAYGSDGVFLNHQIYRTSLHLQVCMIRMSFHLSFQLDILPVSSGRLYPCFVRNVILVIYA
jgi:hypothetical protein